MAFSECYPSSAQAAGGSVAVFCGQVAWFDGTAAEWSAIDAPFDTRVAVVGDLLMGLVSSARNSTTVVRMPLPPGS